VREGKKKREKEKEREREIKKDMGRKRKIKINNKEREKKREWVAKMWARPYGNQRYTNNKLQAVSLSLIFQPSQLSLDETAFF